MLEMGAQWFSGRVHDCVTGSSLMGVTATKGTEVIVNNEPKNNE